MDSVPFQKARQGRENQRYNGDTRLVVGCVVIKENSILLLTSRLEQDKWVLPKGGWENDESELEAAQRETFEEAGVEGDIVKCISQITYMSKSNKPVEFRLFAMNFSKEYDWWPEKEYRQRRWFTESELSSIHLCSRLQAHLPNILDYLHNQAR